MTEPTTTPSLQFKPTIVVPVLVNDANFVLWTSIDDWAVEEDSQGEL